MSLKSLWRKLRTTRPSRPQTDWTTSWTLRDLADLPSYHPRREER